LIFFSKLKSLVCKVYETAKLMNTKFCLIVEIIRMHCDNQNYLNLQLLFL